MNHPLKSQLSNASLLSFEQLQQQSFNDDQSKAIPNNAPDQSSSPSRPADSKVAIFWDFENCAAPQSMPGYLIVENIRNVVHNFGHIVLFKAYLEINDAPLKQQSPEPAQSSQTTPQSNNNNNNSNLNNGPVTKKNLRSELQASGVSLTDCPHQGRKDAADKMLMVDMLAFAIDNPAPATIVLISGDKDYAYALGVLRNRKYTIVLVCPNRGASIVLRSQANTVLEWRYDVLHQDVWQSQQQQQLMNIGPANKSPLSDSSAIVSAEVSPTNTVMSAASSTTSSVAPLVRSGSKRALKVTTVSTTPSPSILVDKQETSETEEYERYIFSPSAPGFFDLLVEVLEKFRISGEPQPRRSKVGNELTNRNPVLYHRAGCGSFKEYIELAAKEGIVDVGGDKGLAWVSLKPDYRDKLT